MSDPAWGRDEFVARLLRRFPELDGRQDASVKGLLHCEMGWFSHQTDAAIESGNFRLVRIHFEFIDEVLANASDELENAIMVSYLENVFSLNTPDTAKARDLLTPRLAAQVAAMSGHFIAAVQGTLPPIDIGCDAEAAAELERRMTKP
jgi:hypothetical protein